MNLSEKLHECINSSQPLLVVLTDEYMDAQENLSDLCRKQCWGMRVWDCDRNLSVDDKKVEKKDEKKPASPLTPAAPNLKPVQQLINAIRMLLDPNASELKERVVLIVRNMHLFWTTPLDDDMKKLIQVLHNFIHGAKQYPKHIVGFMPPSAKVPEELSSLTTVINHLLPAKHEFLDILGAIEADVEVQSDEDKDAITEASCGLTRLQAENAYAVAMTRYDPTSNGPLGPFMCSVVEEYKNEILNVDGMLARHPGSETFDDIGGNEAVKKFLIQAMNQTARRKKSRLRAVTLIGPPGTGKTLLAKALGNHTGIKSYAVDLGKCKGKYVGDTESGVRKLYSRMDAMAPIIAYFDEINEQISGGNASDHSTDKSIVQATLIWLNDHTSDVFVVMTANDVSQMHMALMRPGRVDAIWYVGLPGKEQKGKIWEICLARYALAEQDLPDDAGWGGAEIDACCRIAENLDITLQDAARYIIPSSLRVANQIGELKSWADGRVLDAETGSVYSQTLEVKPEATGALNGITRTRRRVRQS